MQRVCFKILNDYEIELNSRLWISLIINLRIYSVKMSIGFSKINEIGNCKYVN